MKKGCASEWIRAYIKAEGLSREQISRDLEIPVERLNWDCKEPLWADEFLALCDYLSIDLDKILKRD